MHFPTNSQHLSYYVVVMSAYTALCVGVDSSVIGICMVLRNTVLEIFELIGDLAVTRF